MEKIVTKSATNYSSLSFIFKFVFCINSYEFYQLGENDDLIGLLIHYNQKKKKHIISFIMEKYIQEIKLYP